MLLNPTRLKLSNQSRPSSWMEMALGLSSGGRMPSECPPLMKLGLGSRAALLVDLVFLGFLPFVARRRVGFPY